MTRYTRSSASNGVNSPADLPLPPVLPIYTSYSTRSTNFFPVSNTRTQPVRSLSTASSDLSSPPNSQSRTHTSSSSKPPDKSTHSEGRVQGQGRVQHRTPAPLFFGHRESSPDALDCLSGQPSLSSVVHAPIDPSHFVSHLSVDPSADDPSHLIKQLVVPASPPPAPPFLRKSAKDRKKPSTPPPPTRRSARLGTRGSASTGGASSAGPYTAPPLASETPTAYALPVPVNAESPSRPSSGLYELAVPIVDSNLLLIAQAKDPTYQPLTKAEGPSKSAKCLVRYPKRQLRAARNRLEPQNIEEPIIAYPTPSPVDPADSSCFDSPGVVSATALDVSVLPEDPIPTRRVSSPIITLPQAGAGVVSEASSIQPLSQHPVDLVYVVPTVSSESSPLSAADDRSGEPVSPLSGELSTREVRTTGFPRTFKAQNWTPSPQKLPGPPRRSARLTVGYTLEVPSRAASSSAPVNKVSQPKDCANSVATPLEGPQYLLDAAVAELQYALHPSPNTFVSPTEVDSTARGSTAPSPVPATAAPCKDLPLVIARDFAYPPYRAEPFSPAAIPDLQSIGPPSRPLAQCSTPLPILDTPVNKQARRPSPRKLRPRHISPAKASQTASPRTAALIIPSLQHIKMISPATGGSPRSSDSSLTPPPDSLGAVSSDVQFPVADPTPEAGPSRPKANKARKSSGADISKPASALPTKNSGGGRKRRIDSTDTAALTVPAPKAATADLSDQGKQQIKIKLKKTSGITGPNAIPQLSPAIVPENQAPAESANSTDPVGAEQQKQPDAAETKRKRPRKSHRIDSDEEEDAPSPAVASGKTKKESGTTAGATAKTSPREAEASIEAPEKKNEVNAEGKSTSGEKSEAEPSQAKPQTQGMPKIKKKPGAAPPPPAKARFSSPAPPVDTPVLDNKAEKSEALAPPTTSTASSSTSPAFPSTGTPQPDPKGKPRPPVPPKKPIKPPGSVPVGAGSLLSSTLASLTQTPKRDDPAKKDDKDKEKKDASGVKPKAKRIGLWDEEFRLTPEQQKQYDDSAELRRQKREERHRSWGINRINLQESKDGYRADSFIDPVWDDLNRERGPQPRPDPGDLIQMIRDKAEWRTIKSS